MELSRKLGEGIPVQDKDLKVFLKRRLPTQRDHKIILALDESGSMDEPKRTSALAGLLRLYGGSPIISASITGNRIFRQPYNAQRVGREAG